jgi:hypothetical protein
LKNYLRLEFRFVLVLLLVTIILSIFSFTFWYELTFFVGYYLFIHWLGLIATLFIAVSIPIHFILKRLQSRNYKQILRFHTLGSFFAFMLISIHFTQNVGRLAGSLQRLGMGFFLYLILILIVATGIINRYQINKKYLKSNRVIHKYTVIVFYLVMTIHLLQGFNIL